MRRRNVRRNKTKPSSSSQRPHTLIGIFSLSTLCQKFFYAVDDDDDGSSVKIKSNLNISGGPTKKNILPVWCLRTKLQKRNEENLESFIITDYRYDK